MKLAGTIGDYVWLDENGDGVQDAGEAGIANVKVTLTQGRRQTLHDLHRRQRRLRLHGRAGGQPTP